MVCDVFDEHCKICFGFGDKIPVEDVRYSVGGGASNVAVGLTYLGLNALLVSAVGDDVKGKDVLSHLSSHKIDTQYVFVDDKPTDQAIILSYTDERTIFTHNSNRKYDLSRVDFTGVDGVFLSSVGNKVGNLYDQIINLKKKHANLRLFYNPGSRELLNAYDEIQRLVPYMDFLIANVEEGCSILNSGLTRANIDIEDLMALLVKKGIKTVVLTDAVNGVYVATGGKFFHVDAVKTKVAEMTGAGDAFATGFIGGVLYKNDLEVATKWGVHSSSSVISKVGAQNGFLSFDEISRVK